MIKYESLANLDYVRDSADKRYAQSTYCQYSQMLLDAFTSFIIIWYEICCQEEAKRSLIKGKWGLFMFTAYCFYDANKYYPEFLIKRYIEGVEEVKWQ